MANLTADADNYTCIDLLLMNTFLGIDGNSQTEIKNEFGSKTGNIMTLRSIDSYTDSIFFF